MYVLNDQVKYSQLDSEGRMSLKALLDELQDCATMQTRDLGYDILWFIEHKMGWFLTSYQIHLYRMPNMGEHIKIMTSAIGIKGFIGYRGFRIVDEQDRLLSKAYSEWVFMDHQKPGPVRPPQDLVERYSLMPELAEGWGPRKVAIPEDMTEAGSFNVDGIFLDTNHHMNNVHYVEVAEEALEGMPYNSLRIEFKKSAMRDDRVYIKKSVSDGMAVVSLEDGEGNPYCVSEFKMRDNDE